MSGPDAPDSPDGSVRFAGYAAIFDRVDRGGDVIAPGAFADSLTRHGPLPILWQHDPARPVGVVERIAEDARGLRVIGRVSAGRAAGLVKEGTLTGLSFGYRVVAAEGDRPRRLATLDILEVSLVAHPMQPLARIHALD
ncbi:MAG TPA: HK97 family phage prohead protease [Sphingobium sp.]